MSEFELEETPEITIADNPIGKLLLVIIVALTAICLFYFATELTRPEPAPDAAKTEVVSSLNP